MTNAVIFGAGLIAVLTLPALSASAAIWIPVVVVASLLLAAPVAWLIAPRLKARYWRGAPSKGLHRVNSAHPARGQVPGSPAV